MRTRCAAHDGHSIDLSVIISEHCKVTHSINQLHQEVFYKWVVNVSNENSIGKAK